MTLSGGEEVGKARGELDNICMGEWLDALVGQVVSKEH
jgi:hypothetical protein